VTCPKCNSECRLFGKNRNGSQRFQCVECKRTFSERRKALDGMYTNLDATAYVLHLLVEGSSVSSTERVADIHHTTILKALVRAGERCEKLLGRLLVNIPVKDVQCDEIWGFIQKKESHKNPWEANDKNIGDAYCFVAIDRDTKLVLNFALGRRDQKTTDAFIEGLRLATAPQRFQITTDGFIPYVSAICNTLEDRVDFAQLIKVYAQSPEGERRYSPAEVVEALPKPILGDPDAKKICTSHVERQNLTMRMQMRRLTRLTNGFSKKWENHWAALCVHFAWYNLVRIHRTLRMTPAMAAGVTDHIWSIRELLEAVA